MNKTNDRREFIIKSASAAAVVASSAVLGACGDSQKPAEYRYGVASGDPLADQVILWTHAKSIDSNLNVPRPTFRVLPSSSRGLVSPVRKLVSPPKWMSPG